MFIRFTLPNGTHIWQRADQIRSVEKNSTNKLRTMVMLSMRDGYEAEESQEELVAAICNALKTGVPTIVENSAPENPGRLIS